MEVLSFPLLAREILREDLLKSWETTLEGNLSYGRAGVFGGEVFGGTERWIPGSITSLILIILMVMITLIPWAAFHAAYWIAGLPFPVGVISGLLLAWAGASILSFALNLRSELEWTFLAIPVLLSAWVAFKVLWLMFAIPLWLLKGDDRLRYFTFRLGLALLVGGMAAQFVATF